MLLPLLLCALLPSGPGADCPRFRGAAGTGVLAERGFPAEWGPEEHLAWSVEVPGGGWSSPVVVGERVFLTTAIRAEGGGPKGFSGGVSDPMSRGGAGAKPTEEVAFELRCLSLADGTTRWTREVGRRVPAYAVHPSNTYATESPTSDGEHVFVTFGALGAVVAYDLEGEEQWRVELGVHRTGNDFGWGSSLCTHDGLVFAQNDNEEASFLVALEASTGAERWRAARRTGTAWTTPLYLSAGGREQLVTLGPDTAVAYAPATGAELWRVEGIGGSFSASPTCDAERVYFGNSGPFSPGPLVAVPASAEGSLDLRGDGPGAVAWKEDKAGPGFASLVASGPFVYSVASRGILSLHDAATGERLWRERLPDAGTLVASPWIAGDELFLLDENGTTFVVGVGPEFELRRTNTLEGLYWSTPSVAGDALLLRSADRLHCIR